ncbi:hypothetical protein PTMSG1_07628 [Pyrenophora teres f. maculata]|nr:hypothetical protein PTMSG1_07628 [Pyrenophora teres f. maculata]
MPFPRRNFTSSISSREDIVTTTSRGPEIALTDAQEQAILEPVTPETPVNHAQTVALLRVPTRLGSLDIVELLKGDGFTVKKFQMQIDRFTFRNNTLAFAELGSEEEAKRFVQQWSNGTPSHKQIRVQHIKPDFTWARPDQETRRRFPNSKPRYIFAQGNAPHDILRVLEEGRRRMLSVKTPGWFPDTPISEAREKSLDIMERLLSKHGVEAIGGLSPFYGDMQETPRLLCFIDFETKEGAENASREIDDTVVEGKLTWLRPAVPSGWRVDQYAKYDPEYVAELQEKGVLSKETYEDKFVHPLRVAKGNAKSKKDKGTPKKTKATPKKNKAKPSDS